MADLKFQPVRHDHKAYLEKASRRRGFNEAYEALDIATPSRTKCLLPAPAPTHPGSSRHA